MPTTRPQFSSIVSTSETKEIEIFPNRLLSTDTLGRMLNRIAEIEAIVSVILQGERLPSADRVETYTLTEKISGNRKICIQNREIELNIIVGRIVLEVASQENEEIERIAKKIRTISDQLLPFGYNIRVGRFMKRKETLSDYKREWCQRITQI